MKKVFVLGLCLVTSVTVISLKDTTSNKKNLGIATVVVSNQSLVAYENTETSATASVAKIAAKVWNKSCKEILRCAIDDSLKWAIGYMEKSVASVEVEDEINSKLKTL